MMAAQQQQPHVCSSSGRHHLQQHSSSAYSSRCARGRGRLHVCAAVKQRSGKQLCCSKTLTAKEGHWDQVHAMMKEVGEYSQQQMLDRKAGIVLFQVASDHHLAGTFHTWERYESNADFLKHTASPGVMKFMEGVQEHIEGPIGVALYEWNNGNLGPASLNEGPKGEGGLDDATGASGAAGGASMKQTSQAFDLTGGEDTEEEKQKRGFMEGTGMQAAQKQMEGLQDWMKKALTRQTSPFKIPTFGKKKDEAGKK